MADQGFRHLHPTEAEEASIPFSKDHVFTNRSQIMLMNNHDAKRLREKSSAGHPYSYRLGHLARAGW
jgi:hypothetical protein